MWLGKLAVMEKSWTGRGPAIQSREEGACGVDQRSNDKRELLLIE
jgi:hypothetical protein